MRCKPELSQTLVSGSASLIDKLTALVAVRDAAAEPW